jgi:hypothetical protein
MRFHVESAAVSFVVVGLVARVIRGRRVIDSSRPATLQRLPVWTMFAWWLSAAVLYWPALWIGFLSDDFGLADHAARGAIGFVTPELFRPIPLAVWGIILRAGGGPVVIHLVNVLLHGTNAYLATRIAEAYVRDRLSVVLAGILVLSFPLGPEAVVWAAGVFDVMATAWILVAVQIARGYGSSPSGRRRIALAACAAAALLSKETAAVVPLLIAIDAWATDRLSRPLFRDVGVLSALFAGVGALRLTSGSQLVNQPIGKFMVQRWAFGTFENAAFPWHAAVLHDMRWMAVVAALAIIGLATSFFLRTEAFSGTRAAFAMACWMLISTLPVMTIFIVASDLQGARYMYLAGIGWAVMVGCFVSGTSSLVRRFSAVGAFVIAVSYVVALPSHLLPWRRAAGLRDRVEQAASIDRDMRACSAVHVANLPDNLDGAYVMRNGVAEAFGRDLGLRVSSDAVDTCWFSWDDSRGVFLPRGR